MDLPLRWRRKGQTPEAIAHYKKALDIEPDFTDAAYNLASAYVVAGRVDDAINEYQQAMKLGPANATAHFNLANSLLARQRLDEAAAQYQEACSLRPEYFEARNNFGVVLYGQGKIAEAVVQWREAARLQPNSVGVLCQLAWTLATSADASLRNGPEAIELTKRAMELSGKEDASVLSTLAAAHAANGDFAEATIAAKRAEAIASQNGNKALADAIKVRIELYRADKADYTMERQRPQ